ncbi:Hypothetical protein ZAZAV_413 [Cedratvirus Zaza IHUMI]|uniref:Uncharacterized protein n=1 Tax=Cedratvirus Zaza IHUMI TaxID=2126979 RepID=A0A2R8FF60_9VIRU|nr:hypothetical protein Cplu_395 [Cedratvirus plubellavi]SPN79639.1 Hypothetical protein ZAZAV_413 [Cedratvirus Zaza IHUMI]
MSSYYLTSSEERTALPSSLYRMRRETTNQNMRDNYSGPRERAVNEPRNPVRQTTYANLVRSYNTKGEGNYPISKPQGHTREVLPRPQPQENKPSSVVLTGRSQTTSIVNTGVQPKQAPVFNGYAL